MKNSPRTTTKKRVIITGSLSTIIAVSERKRSKNPKTQLIRKLIDQASTNITMGFKSRRYTRKRNSRLRSKRSTKRKIHHTETYHPQDLIKWIKEKHEQEQQKNQERAKTRQHNEHKQQNKPLTHWIYQSHPFWSNGQRTQPAKLLLRSKSHHRSHPTAM
jgi:hypothetical protein